MKASSVKEITNGVKASTFSGKLRTVLKISIKSNDEEVVENFFKQLVIGTQNWLVEKKVLSKPLYVDFDGLDEAVFGCKDMLFEFQPAQKCGRLEFEGQGCGFQSFLLVEYLQKYFAAK